MTRDYVAALVGGFFVGPLDGSSGRKARRRYLSLCSLGTHIKNVVIFPAFREYRRGSRSCASSIERLSSARREFIIDDDTSALVAFDDCFCWTIIRFRGGVLDDDDARGRPQSRRDDDDHFPGRSRG